MNKKYNREGLKTLEILVEAYISARDNKTISLPLRYQNDNWNFWL